MPVYTQTVRKLIIVSSLQLFLPTAANSADPQTSPVTPLLDAFKQFCVDTGAKPEAVRTVVGATGGKPGKAGSTNFPFQMTTESWDVTFQDHHMIVSTGSLYPPPRSSGDSPTSVDHCSINSFANEDPSVAAIQKWTGVPANHVSTGNRFLPTSDLTTYFYGFQTVGSEHSVPSQAELQAAISEGRYWQLVLSRDTNSASVDLSH